MSDPGFPGQSHQGRLGPVAVLLLALASVHTNNLDTSARGRGGDAFLPTTLRVAGPQFS